MSEPIEPALEAALRENPDGDRSVYGDWLQQQGHPRGELIALQTAGLRDEAARLLERHPELAPFPSNPHSWLEWDRGFLRYASFQEAKDELVEALVRHPAARFLRELYVHAPDSRSTLAILCENPPLPLRSLGIYDDENDAQPFAAEPCRQFPTLEALDINGTPLAMQMLGDRLVGLEVIWRDWPEPTAGALATCKLPALRTVDFLIDSGSHELLKPFFCRTDLLLDRVHLFGDVVAIEELRRDSPFADRFVT